MKKKIIFTLDDILEILPHRRPFLFIDRITDFRPGKMIEGEWNVREDEPYFKGHFPGNPVLPGVLIADSLAQTSGLLWGFTKKTSEGTDNDKIQMFYLAGTDIKFIKPAFPGDTITLRSFSQPGFGKLFPFQVEAFRGNRQITKGKLTLAVIEEDR